MNETTAYVIGGVLLAVVIIALVVGPRLREANFNVGKFFGAKIKATGEQSATVAKMDVDGTGNEAHAKGAGAKVVDVKVKGDTNKFTAET